MNIRHLLATSMGVLPVSTMGQGFIDAEKIGENLSRHPNVILIMADDLGYGDVGFTGNRVVQTPSLDQMARDGVVFRNFYTASAVSSPTRGSVLTGRAPFRYGILAAHTAGMRRGEVTIAEALQKEGYATGFFGKWHLGGVVPDRAGKARGIYTPPQEHGFEKVFCTESAVPTWNPTLTPEGWKGWGKKQDNQPKEWGGSKYYHNGVLVTENLEGDDSRIIMDRVEDFVREHQSEPFLATIWFHTPHQPVVAGPEYRALYKDLSEGQQNLYGAITAMDEQIGRLRALLKEQGIAENTIIFFCSDNGPDDGLTKKGVASAGPFRGHKHQMYEGGVRVPSLMLWEGTLRGGGECPVPMCTTDYMPTILDILGLKPVKDRPMDGVSMLPVLEGAASVEREFPITIGFMRLYQDLELYALLDGDYKLCVPVKGSDYQLYNLKKDPYETTDLATAEPEKCAALVKKLEETKRSWLLSRDGKDYAW